MVPAAVAGRPVTSSRSIAGGDINDAYLVTLEGGASVFLKTRADAAPGEYAAEAAGLAWLADGGARVPEVIEATDTYLALEWLEPGHLSPEGEVSLGHTLAHLHRAAAPWNGVSHLENPTNLKVTDPFSEFADARLRIGALELPNGPVRSWSTFYAEARIRPLAQRTGIRAAERVADRMDELVGPDEPPSRLHGDLWAGNVHASGGVAYLIDPAAYGGHREVDLAMLRLFGAPSPRTLAAYAEVWPLAEGHEDRVELYQLFPLLVHAALFGGSYVGSAERVARRYAG